MRESATNYRLDVPTFYESRYQALWLVDIPEPTPRYPSTPSKRLRIKGNIQFEILAFYAYGLLLT